MESVDCVVIGAGVVGLACARALARAGREVLILEREGAIGSGISARNSEVVHAGLYYPPGSLKAALCVRGREMLYRYCAERGIGCARTGKLVVAAKSGQVAALEAVRARALDNGVTDIAWLHGDQVPALEPELDVEAALFSPSTGIVDSHRLMLSLLGDAQRHGAVLALRSAVCGGVANAAGILLDIASEGSDRVRVRTRCAINAGGLAALAIARSLDLPHDTVPRGWFARGVYFSYAGRMPFTHLIYPVPEPGGLGVHLTLDQAGQGRFGPDVEWIDAPDYTVDPARAEGFYRAIRQWWPRVERARLAPGYAGVRPKLAGPGMADGDFRIDGPDVHGVPGLVNLFGIESPGLTACLAIGERVAGLV
ncbi:MAG: NAD(P)/FAD-dependent oxidoreductase [Porticoccaceae bacterium]